MSSKESSRRGEAQNALLAEMAYAFDAARSFVRAAFLQESGGALYEKEEDIEELRKRLSWRFPFEVEAEKTR
jgi:hypothetical protein